MNINIKKTIVDEVNIYKNLPSNKTFGLFFTSIFFILSLYFFHINYNLIASITIILCFLTFIFSIFSPNSLRIYNYLWMKFGIFLGKIVSPIIMGLIFFGIFTPIAILMKIFTRDELNLKFTKKTSYWKNKENFSNENNKFTTQF